MKHIREVSLGTAATTGSGVPAVVQAVLNEVFAFVIRLARAEGKIHTTS